MGEAIQKNYCDGNDKNDSERPAGLAENGFFILVAPTSGGAKSLELTLAGWFNGFAPGVEIFEGGDSWPPRVGRLCNT